MSQTVERASHGVQMTPAAAQKVRTLIDQEGEAGAGLRLRLAVQPGGCSGLIYSLGFDDALGDDDAVRDFDGVELVVDRLSVPYLDGATVDFSDTIARQGFTIDNPNATDTCACGGSFH